MISRRYLKALLIGLTLAVLLIYPAAYGLGGPASERGTEKATAAQGPSAAEDSESAPKRSIQMQEIQIRGEVEKPKAMFIIPHAPSDFAPAAGHKDFSDDILMPIDMDKVNGMVGYQNSLP
jgi:hypothetical protein